MYYPNVWGDGGALFAFSGMDGTTDAVHPLVGSTLADGRGFVFHTEGRPVLRFGMRVGEAEFTGASNSPFSSVEDEIVAGGVTISGIQCHHATVRLEYVFAQKDTVAVRVTCQSAASPVTAYVESRIQECDTRDHAGRLIQRSGDTEYALACNQSLACADASRCRVSVELVTGSSVTFAWALSSSDAAAIAAKSLSLDFDALVATQLAFFSALPEPDTSDPALARTFSKCASVMKVNCCSAQGDIELPWTTPDRWPHRYMWIWDSAFHAIALRHFSSEWAENAIKAVLSTQRDSGFIPHMMTPDRTRDSHISQPPILAWASWRVYESGRNLDYLAQVYAPIGRLIRYQCDALDSDGNGLSEWENGCASGMDNSPRFDQPLKDAVDLNSFITNDMRYLAHIARAVGREAEAADWDAQADERAERINALLWDEDTGFYYDNAPDNSLIKIKTEAGFTPLFAGICDHHRAERLVQRLTSESEFWRPFPVASVSAEEPTFCDNMWRGPVWINYNYLIIEALSRYGYSDISAQLRSRTIEEISRWYNTDGLIYEYYDSEATTNPVFLHRKKQGGPQAQKAAALLGTNVCDYNWTAALYIDLLMSDKT